MLRYLLLAAALAAMGTLIWLAWKQGPRRLTWTLGGVVLFLLLMTMVLWETEQNDLVDLSVERISVQVEQARGLETGIRLSGRLLNRSDHGLAQVRARVVLEQCPRDLPCQELGSAPLTLLLHVPVGSQSPWSQIVRLPRALLDPDQEDRQWRVEVLQARGYARSGGPRL